MENSNTSYLIHTVVSELLRHKIILPAMASIEMLVWEARKLAEEKIYSTINNCITSSQKLKLDELLQSKMNKNLTRLAWLKISPTNLSPDSFADVIEKLEYIRQLDLNIDTGDIHHNRLIQLSRLGAKYEAQAFQRFEETKRYAVLVIYLLDLSQDLTKLLKSMTAK